MFKNWIALCTKAKQLLTSAAVKPVLFELKNVTESVKRKRKKTPVPSPAVQFLQKLGLPNP